MQSTILSVDDDEASRYVIASTLRRSGFIVLEADTGEYALNLALKQPDLVLLDVNLPDISGFEVCRRLKNDPKTASIPVVHISATRLDSNAAAEGLEGGADGYLTQPVEPEVLVATINAVLRAKKAELQWQITFDSILDGICLLGPNKEILKYNKAFHELLNLQEHPLSQITINDLLKSSKDFSPDKTVQDFHIGDRCFHMTLHDVKNAMTEPNGFVLTIADITERKRAQETLQMSDERLRAVLDNTTAFVYIVDRSNKFLLVNRQFEFQFGKAHQEFTGKSLSEIFGPDIVEPFLKNNAEVYEHLAPMEFEESAPLPDGMHTFISIKVPLFDKDGYPYAICGISTDITERKRGEEVVKASLQEKEMLLQEIHHRVKNNLQVIISLLGLQSQHISDSQALRILEESRSRIQAMALIHENLYTEHGAEGVNLNAYLRLLTSQIFSGYSLNKNIDLAFHGEHVTVDVNRAVPIGLILNELLTNSLKYAYDDVSHGELEVSVKETDGKIILTTRDNGCGLPPLEQLNKSKTLGWNLITLLIRQIDGKLEVLTDNPGTNIRITFSRT
ncbi:MAG TPA: histidine kinase dimerization/phosphoacceptor domain -containing protein [Acidobacteriota bacterium]|nr:histidine kinase dimerization/phosphoacceptor domain -containing protein [Acidobacteriota bacterium]